MEVSFPLDSDGFIRRECPHCEREFKWHHGPANEGVEQQPPWDTTIAHCVASLPVLTHGGRKLNWN